MNPKTFLFIKRLFDIVFSLALLLSSFPIFMIICISIKLDSHGPIFIKDKRIGKDGTPFYLLKFRTRDIYTSEISRVGYFLRYFDLWVLPQLINILKGELSFVGPRPAREFEVEHYKDFEKQRLNCKPGMTGLAQIYIDDLSDETYDKRIKIDIAYVNNRSMFLDIKILLKSFTVVISGKKQ